MNADVWQARWVLPAIGLVGGLSLVLNHLASTRQLLQLQSMPVQLATAAITVAFIGLLYVIRAGSRRLVRRMAMSAAMRQAYLRCDNLGFLPVLLLGLGAFGIRFPAFSIVLFVMAGLAVIGLAVYWLAGRDERLKISLSLQWLAALFFFSGFAAVIYQIVWLLDFRRHGVPIFRLDQPDSQSVLETLVASDMTDVGDRFRARDKLGVITDDNMLTEYKIDRKWYDKRLAWLTRLRRRLS